MMSLIDLILSWDESVMTGKRFRSIVVTISVSFRQRCWDEVRYVPLLLKFLVLRKQAMNLAKHAP